LAKLDEPLDRIEELEHLDHESMKGRIHPFHKRFKKLKVRGDVALRPILVRGPVDQEHEVTFLLVAREQNRKLDPPKKEAVRIASDRLDDILDDPRRRRRYDRD
jgi:hypothetical protein